MSLKLLWDNVAYLKLSLVALKHLVFQQTYFATLFSETFASILVLMLIFWQLLLIELLECSRHLALLRVVLRLMKKLFRESGILVFINNLGYMALLKGALSYRAIS